MRWRPFSSVSAWILAAALGSAGCGPAASAAAAGHIYIAGSGQLRAVDAGTLTAQGQLSLPGPVVAAAMDNSTAFHRQRLDLLLGGDAPALVSVAMGEAPLRVVARRGLDVSPVALRLDAADEHAYILGGYGTGPGKLIGIDLASGRIAGEVMTGDQPADLALTGDGTLLAVANAGSHTVGVYSLPALKGVSAIALNAAPTQVLGLSYGRKLFALCGDTVAVIDLGQRQLLTYLPVGPEAQQMLAKPDGGEVYVSNASGSVSVINTSTNEVATTMPAGLGAGAMAVAPDGSALYVANARAGTISVLSLADRTMLAVVHVGEKPSRLQLGTSGEFLFAADTGSDDLAVVRSNRDPANPNTLVTLLPSPPQATLLMAGTQ